MIINAQSGNFKVTIDLQGNYSPEEIAKVQMAASHMAMAIGSEKFKQFCKDFNYSYRSCSGMLWWKRCKNVVVDAFNWNKGLTNKAIYKRIMSGQEELRPGVDNEADITLIIDRRRTRNVVGYTYPNSIKQWIYSKFFNRYTYKEVAGNIAHEWCHKLGFDHARGYHYTRQFTIPYSIGYFVRDFEI